MDSRKYMLLVNGQDKTDSVASFRFQNGMCEVIYANSPKSYRYHAEKVQLLKVQNRIDPSQVIITVDGNPFTVFSEQEKRPLHTQKAKWNSRKTA